MANRDHAQMRKRLEEEREQLLHTIHTREAEILEYADRQANDQWTYSNHLADAGSQTFEVQKDFALERNARSLLDEVEAALVKMEKGTYGLCERCGKPIPEERLEAIPHATLCVPCKSEVERTSARVA